jgi:GH25 family lysozyme M1 (1,4-beta-N-acetylmuramidase)
LFPDISEHQGAVDWNALGAAFQAGQVEAVSMRAGFGTVRADNQFARNQAECRARGIPAIYYWFNYPTFNSPQAEAAMFNRVVGPLRDHEALMADFEDDPSSNSVFPRGEAGIDWANAFLTALESPQNATWFYTYTSLFNAVGMSPLLATWPFVWADYSAAPDSAFPAIARQFTDCGSTPGVTGCCDQNRVLTPPLAQWLTGGSMPLDYSAKLGLVAIIYSAVLGGGPVSQPEADQWAAQIGPNGEGLWAIYQAIAASGEAQTGPPGAGRVPTGILKEHDAAIKTLQVTPVGKHTHSVTVPAEAAQTLNTGQPQ